MRRLAAFLLLLPLLSCRVVAPVEPVETWRAMGPLWTSNRIDSCAVLIGSVESFAALTGGTLSRLPDDPQALANVPPPQLVDVRGHVVGDQLVIEAKVAKNSPTPLTHTQVRFRFWLDLDQNPRTPGHHETPNPRDTSVCDKGSEFVLPLQPFFARDGLPPGGFWITQISPHDCDDGPVVGSGLWRITGRTVRWYLPLAVLQDDGAATVRLTLGAQGASYEWPWYVFDTRGKRGRGRCE